MKLLGSTENKIANDKNGKNVPHLEISEVVLIHYNIVYIFVPNKSFRSLLEICPKNHNFLKRFNSEFWEPEVWFTD